MEAAPARPSLVTSVLLVDDDAAIRDVAARLLAAHGYSVISASC